LRCLPADQAASSSRSASVIGPKRVCPRVPSHRGAFASSVADVGYYQQHQYLPLFVYEGTMGFPLAAWLRPGTVHASLGAAEILDRIIGRLRAACPGAVIKVRSDNGLAVPGLYDYCEREDLPYALGYATNAVLERLTAQALADVQEYHHWYQHREPHMQRFESLSTYQADSWPHPRRIVAKIEVTRQGSQRRFVVTNLTEPAEWVYRTFMCNGARCRSNRLAR